MTLLAGRLVVRPSVGAKVVQFLPVCKASFWPAQNHHARCMSLTGTRQEQRPLFQLDKALLPNLHPSTSPLSLTVPDSGNELWAVIAPPTSSGPGSKVLSALLGVLAGRTRPRQSSDTDQNDIRMHPSAHPFTVNAAERIGFASFAKQEHIVGGNDFQDYSKRYGALREEDHVTLFESIMHDQGFEVGKVAEMRIVPDKLSDTDLEVRSRARETRSHIERLAPLLGLHKPGPGSPGGVPLLHQPMISLSNGQTRRARICGALVSLARQHAAEKAPAATTLLILDQPFSGLDEPSRDELSSLLGTLHAKGSPRALLILRRQDELPQGVTHIVDVDAEGKVWTGSRADWSGSEAARPKGVDGIKRNHARGIGVGRAQEVARLHNVSIQYGSKVVLDSVYLTLRQGSRLIVKGANGSGKTTLLSLLTGTHPQSYAFDVGSYALFEQARSAPGNATRLLNRRIGYFGPDLLAAFPRRGPEIGGLSVGEAIASGYEGVFSRIQTTEAQHNRVLTLTRLFADCFGFRDDRSDARQQKETTTASVQAMLQRPFIALNAGSQALALILRAAIHQPALLILDEPFQGMDAMQIARVRHFIDASTENEGEDRFAIGCSEQERQTDMQKRREAAVVLVSHYINEWPDLMGEYVLLHDGKVVERI